MIVRALLVNFVLKNILLRKHYLRGNVEDYMKIPMPPKAAAVHNEMSITRLSASDQLFSKFVALQHNVTSGCDERGASYYPAEPDIRVIRDHIVKYELLKKLEDIDIPDVEKMRLIANYKGSQFSGFDLRLSSNDITPDTSCQLRHYSSEEQPDENWE